MSMETSDRQQEIEAFEHDAAYLALEQLELVAQLEEELRAVRQTMTHINKLRDARSLSNDQREAALSDLAKGVTVLEQLLDAETTCCAEIKKTIARMFQRVANLRRVED